MDRNGSSNAAKSHIHKSLSARRAWIEISIRKSTPAKPFSVALRKESVDRNICVGFPFPLIIVALRKESVDRNNHSLNLPSSPIESLSARRAWIEILLEVLNLDRWLGRSPQGERG